MNRSLTGVVRGRILASEEIVLDARQRNVRSLNFRGGRLFDLAVELAASPSLRTLMSDVANGIGRLPLDSLVGLVYSSQKAMPSFFYDASPLPPATTPLNEARSNIYRAQDVRPALHLPAASVKELEDHAGRIVAGGILQLVSGGNKVLHLTDLGEMTPEESVLNSAAQGIGPDFNDVILFTAGEPPAEHTAVMPPLPPR
jgi:hypothetical protein